ncbi:MAG TPA: SRPBCC family protein [Mycobacteriales bacterium]|nr:SRPBCC family protein [Mycobacteriales bacterium]
MTDCTREARTVSVTIDRPPKTVYDYLADPAQIPRWSYFESIEPSADGQWTVTGPEGETATMTFAPPNGFGVVDQNVEVAPGEWVHVPLRVVPNGDGSEVLFTAFRQPRYTDADFDADVVLVRTDLDRLKRILEAG